MACLTLSLWLLAVAVGCGFASAGETIIQLPNSSDFVLDGQVATRVWVDSNTCASVDWFALYGARSSTCYSARLSSLGVDVTSAGLPDLDLALLLTCESLDPCSSWHGQIWVSTKVCTGASGIALVNTSGSAGQCVAPEVLGIFASLLPANIRLGLQVSCGNFSACVVPTPAPTPAPTPQPTATAVSVRLTLAMTFPTDLDAFRLALRTELASALGVAVSRFRIDSVTAGSVVVQFTILPPASLSSNEDDAETLFAQFSAQVNTSNSSLRSQNVFASASTVDSRQDETLLYCSDGTWAQACPSNTDPSSTSSGGGETVVIGAVGGVVAIVAVVTGVVVYRRRKTGPAHSSSTTREYPIDGETGDAVQL